MKEKLYERLERYAKIDTQSSFDTDTTPSTEKQWNLIRELERELKAIGLTDVKTDAYGYLFATLKGNVEGRETVGFLAHVDTTTDFTSTHVSPQRVEYTGGDIVLNKEQNIVMEETMFPNLNDYVGHTLMTTDGTTLLGADNKAGIAEIVTAIEYLIDHPEIEHGDVRIGFTPDEEIGLGPEKFDVERFNADFAYTVDGSRRGELQYENFNAASARIDIRGEGVHPGSAKGKLVNASRIGAELIATFDPLDTPEHTEGYEGFYHLLGIESNTEHGVLAYIIRDHDKEKFNERKLYMAQVVNDFNEKYDHRLTLEMQDSYFNMKEKVEEKMYVIDIAKDAMEALDISPVIEPIRGGTDGSQLSFKGLVTPNLFTGGENFHGKYEFASLDVMVDATHVIIEIIKRVK